MCFGEFFNSSIGGIDWKSYRYPQSQKLKRQLDEDPVSFLEKQVFCNFPSHIEAVGFKIFYQHAKTSKSQKVWKRLENSKDFKIIHLRRENILKTVLSLQKAFQTDRWINTANALEPSIQVKLEYEYLANSFLEIKNYEKEYDKLFRHHSVLNLTYENLLADSEKETNRIQKFLNLNEATLVAKTHRQSSQSLSDSITNYKELKARFSDSQWAKFFDE
jgi:LPS sulfotransferase NodH